MIFSALTPSFRPRQLVLALGLSTLAMGAWSQNIIFNEDFGSTTTRQSSPLVPQFLPGVPGGSYYMYADPAVVVPNGNLGRQRQILDAYYTIINPAHIYDNNSGAGDWWKRGTSYKWTALPTPVVSTTNPLGLPANSDWDRTPVAGSNPAAFTYYGYRTFNPAEYKDTSTPSGDGAVMVVNAGNVSNDIYRRVVALQAGKSYRATANFLYVQSPGSLAFTLYKADVSDFPTGLARSNPYTPQTRNFGRADGPAAPWQAMDWTFTVAPGCADPNFALAITNLNQATGGNDLFLDDIKLEETTGTGPQVCPTGGTPAKLALADPKDDSSTTPVNTPVDIAVVGNDQVLDENGAVTTLVTLTKPVTKTQPPNGTLTQKPDGSYTDTPNPGWFGTDTFTYEVCTTTSATYPSTNCKTATVTIKVVDPSASNVSVTANDKSATTPQDTPVAVDLLGDASSSDPTGAPLQTTPVAGSTTPQNGQVVFNPDGTATYTPKPGYTGTDTFSYQACTQIQAPYTQSKCTEKLVTVTVTATGQPPVVTPAQPVPVNSWWAVVMAALALAGAAVWQQRRQRQ